MKSWQRWIKAPQTHWLHRLLFQVHLWMGIGVGLYILLISVTGSAVVLRPEFNRWFVENRVRPNGNEAFKGEELAEVIKGVYKGYDVLTITPPPYPSRAVYVVLEKNGEEFEHYFNQYTGVDQGETYPWQVETIESLVRLHDELWLDQLGRKINGVGGAFFIMMVLSGLIIWWQGRARWKQSLMISRNSQRSFNWQLHSFIGFWTFLLMFSWGLTGVYFAFPEPFEKVIDGLDSDLDDFERPDAWLMFLLKIHFGRFGGLWGRITWMILGLLPAVMFITGFILWWKRVIRRG